MNGIRFPIHVVPPPSQDVLARRSLAVARWFREQFGEPTPIQRLTWPLLERQLHLLVSAPTGTGKTLAVFVPLLEALLAPPQFDNWSMSRLRVLYVAPLKALVNDAARTLQSHLENLQAYLPPGSRLPSLAVRTGDTPALERRQLRDEPPDLLLTTPESLAVLLSQSMSSSLFANLRYVVVDEVHALAGNKRGADLALSLERLEALTAPASLCRLGLSATATPLETALRWLVGADRAGEIVCAIDTALPEFTIEPLPDGSGFLGGLLDRVAGELPRHRAVLIFTNTRALAERLSWGLRRRLPGWHDLIAVHHSALAAGRRQEVESRFKRGDLRVVVSSTSLELGIDIGTVDLAILVHPPGDVIRLLQRIGRAGHEPGGVRRGLLLTASAADLLEAAVTCASGRAGQTEPLSVARAPLDVLCQQILGMCCARSWDPEEMYALVRRSTPYADLSREDFDAALRYLRGLDARNESWIPARLREDGDCWRVRNAKTARLLRRNLGTILAERTVSVRLREQERQQEIGEVDESFADRLQPGDRFLLDGRCLEYRQREGGAALVDQVIGRPRVPLWNSGGWPISPQLARRLYLLRMQASEALRDGPSQLHELLRSDYGLLGSAVDLLAAYFHEQECVSEIPDAGTLLLEAVGREDGVLYFLHTPLNRPGNDALARVIVRRLARDVGRSAASEVADLGLQLRLRAPLPDVAELMRRLLDAEGFEPELNAALQESESLRSRFAQVAQTGLMVLRNPEGKPRKVGGADWAERRLFEQVRSREADFVLLRQALREIRLDLCDVESAREYVRMLPRITIRCRWLARPSPFARAWTQAESGEPDATRTPAEALAQLHAELMGGGRAGSE